MQLDRRVDGIRWVNAGSVGMPYEGEVAAFWALLGPDVELRRTPFDVERSVDVTCSSPAGPTRRASSRRICARPFGAKTSPPVFEEVAIDRGER